jgi:hypothetical protein
MPLSVNARNLIRANLEEIQNGGKVRPIIIGTLTTVQLAAINASREADGRPPVIAEVVFFGAHVYRSRVLGDGYTIEDVIDQISSAMDEGSVVNTTSQMTAMENPDKRADRYGNQVKDRAVFECTARHPRPELYSVVPKGDAKKPT